MSFLSIDKENGPFLENLKSQVYQRRYQAARQVNKELILLYHHIGSEILRQQKEQGWGAKVIDQLSKDLRSEFTEMKGFSTRNLKYMRKFAENYPDSEFVQQVAALLPWFHLATIMDRVKDKEYQIFYMEKATEYRWSRNGDT